jgi:hypothetical protein
MFVLLFLLGLMGVFMSMFVFMFMLVLMHFSFVFMRMLMIIFVFMFMKVGFLWFMFMCVGFLLMLFLCHFNHLLKCCSQDNIILRTFLTVLFLYALLIIYIF